MQSDDFRDTENEVSNAADAASEVVRVEDRIANIDAQAFDALANPDPARFNPFVAHAFLDALEVSGCAGPQTGWLPQHLVLEDDDGSIAGIMPGYLKSHSRGEFVFDFSWAEAYHHAGGRYYPKFQAAVPFTPVTGPRLFVKRGENATRFERILAAAAIQYADKAGASSVHMTFVEEQVWRRLGEEGYLQRTDQQFHFLNPGYGSFDDFLSTLASRKRKALRKERTRALQAGLTIKHLTGSQITEADWDAFYDFYINTGSRKYGQPYLNREFFSLLSERMPDSCLLIFATRNGDPIAGALNMIGGDCLYGRYWGAIEHHPFLHFELCYYQAIDYAIAHGLARVEAGAQGQHKLVRGYVPQTTYSLHWFSDYSLSVAIERYLESEREQVDAVQEILAEAAPFKKTLASPFGPEPGLLDCDPAGQTKPDRNKADRKQTGPHQDGSGPDDKNRN
ncbi:MAG: GNAT family N-acetyltransferase [Alphaproteobacteria bacterium]|nr:GNAT family N-acetyltransferase [Alphaproteobacteria bacterium]